MMGGGNTFRLLDSLYALGVIDELGRRVREGVTRYVGASAGTNVACPTIRTTNDMPICRPSSFTALGLVPFQINLHYIDADPASTFMGETRDERIEEFLEENDCEVLALYEGSWLRVSGERAAVTGQARLFHRAALHTFLTVSTRPIPPPHAGVRRWQTARAPGIFTRRARAAGRYVARTSPAFSRRRPGDPAAPI